MANTPQDIARREEMRANNLKRIEAMKAAEEPAKPVKKAKTSKKTKGITLDPVDTVPSEDIAG